MPEIIQEIGAYAGLASVVGLAVLSALYFSQARDVKRLREWAGRAPERAEQGAPAVPGRVVAQPQPQSQPQAKPAAQPQEKPEPARPSAPPVPSPAAAAVASGAPPVPVPAAGPAPATAAAAAKPAVAAAAAPGPATAVANSKGPIQAPPKPPVAAPALAGGNSGAKPPVPPVPPVSRPSAPQRPVSQPTAIIPPPRNDPWYRRLLASPRYVVLVIAGVLIIGGAAAFGVTQLLSDDDASPSTGSPTASGERQLSNDEQATADENQGRRRRAGVNPANVTVAVLNGTTVPGLAATLSDKVEQAGFQEGTIANFLPNQQLGESVVQYTAGHEREAAAVSRRLDIPQREAANPSSQELAGDATVIVLVGADKAP